MRRLYFTIVLIPMFFFACDGITKMSLTSYHEKVVAKFNVASEKMAVDREKIYEHNLSKEENQAVIDDLNQCLDECITMMDGLNYPDDAKDFHEAMLGLYHFEKDSIMPLLSKTLEFQPESRQWYDVWNEFDKRNRRVDEMLTVMEKRQEELATKAGQQVR
jgi:hypothetical protein